MATFRTTSISAGKGAYKRLSLGSLASLASIESGSSIESKPIVVTTTVSTTTATYPMTVPPPFATSLGSDERLPRPRRGAPPVAPAQSAAERKQAQQSSLLRTLRSTVGLETTRIDPALCEGWWYVPASFLSILVLINHCCVLKINAWSRMPVVLSPTISLSSMLFSLVLVFLAIISRPCF
ncbi:hypothetical protein K438DRAFT_1986578 [Mycena galopus ATCC 62051]|nr:hypothetical protein K438DRAFT_1986578 [Mycena galopus ATCC 62051]